MIVMIGSNPIVSGCAQASLSSAVTIVRKISRSFVRRAGRTGRTMVEVAKSLGDIEAVVVDLQRRFDHIYGK